MHVCIFCFVAGSEPCLLGVVFPRLTSLGLFERTLSFPSIISELPIRGCVVDARSTEWFLLQLKTCESSVLAMLLELLLCIVALASGAVGAAR